MKKLTENARRHIGETVTIRWGTSRGQDSYGYTTCSLRNHAGKRVAACNGGGYDMRGTVLGNWVASTFSKELCALKPSEMPKHSHYQNDPGRVCWGECQEKWRARHLDSIMNETPEPAPLPVLPDDCYECPTCKGPTRNNPAGKTVDDGHSFYGLTFHDPNYDPKKAVIGKDCSDRTLTKAGETSEGKTVEEAEQAGVSFGLERYQAFYSASSKTPTKRHTVPLIDGACGESCVLDILRALGLVLRKIHDTKKLDVYIIEQFQPSR